MSGIIPIVIVALIFVVLLIGWWRIATQPDKWVPPPPPKGPASRAEVQRRAQKSVDSLAPQGKRGVRRVPYNPHHYRRAA